MLATPIDRELDNSAITVICTLQICKFSFVSHAFKWTYIKS